MKARSKCARACLIGGECGLACNDIVNQTRSLAAGKSAHACSRVAEAATACIYRRRLLLAAEGGTAACFESAAPESAPLPVGSAGRGVCLVSNSRRRAGCWVGSGSPTAAQVRSPHHSHLAGFDQDSALGRLPPPPTISERSMEPSSSSRRLGVLGRQLCAAPDTSCPLDAAALASMCPQQLQQVLLHDNAELRAAVFEFLKVLLWSGWQRLPAVLARRRRRCLRAAAQNLPADAPPSPAPLTARPTCSCPSPPTTTCR